MFTVGQNIPSYAAPFERMYHSVTFCRRGNVLLKSRYKSNMLEGKSLQMTYTY